MMVPASPADADSMVGSRRREGGQVSGWPRGVNEEGKKLAHGEICMRNLSMNYHAILAKMLEYRARLRSFVRAAVSQQLPSRAYRERPFAEREREGGKDGGAEWIVHNGPSVRPSVRANGQERAGERASEPSILASVDPRTDRDVRLSWQDFLAAHFLPPSRSSSRSRSGGEEEEEAITIRCQRLVFVHVPNPTE